MDRNKMKRYEFRTRDELLFGMGTSPLVFFNDPTSPANVEVCVMPGGATFMCMCFMDEDNDIFVRIPFCKGGMTHELEFWKAPELMEVVRQARLLFNITGPMSLANGFQPYWVCG